MLSTIVNPSVVIVSKSVEPVNVPLGFVAVTLPVMLISPVPVMSLLFKSKFPPSCPVVSSTTSFVADTVASTYAFVGASCAAVKQLHL